MKAYSNVPLSVVSEKWKSGQYAYYFNHKDNGAQSAGEEGRRYEADFTIMDGYSASSAIEALTRKQNDETLEQKVIDNIEVEGRAAITVKINYPVKASANLFPTLPTAGLLKKGAIYSYNNGAVMVIQDHERTIYAPELTPALFSFYREVTEGQQWITGEQIILNATRIYNGKAYKCIQAHQSQDSWNPELTLGTLWQVVATSSAWTVGVAYKVNDVVTYQSKTYKCLQAHASQAGWTPVAVPALWQVQ